MRNENAVLRRVRRLEVEPFDVRFDEIRKQQVREQRQLPRVRFLLIEDEVNDFAQFRVRLLINLLELFFQQRDGGWNGLEENCWGWV